MPIIKPSLKFEGSDLNLSNSVPYIKEGIKRAVFNKSTNQDGAWLYFLPAYRADRAGNGVWYKKVYIRDNFGTNYKEKYYVANRAQDPAEYFGNNFRALYPMEAKVTEQEVKGKKFKKYPNYGRITERVVYNVAFVNEVDETLDQVAAQVAAGNKQFRGVFTPHVLDLPLRNGADGLMNYVEGRDSRGNQRAPINDPDHCLPVFVQLRDAGTSPWLIQVDNNDPRSLPDDLADSDKLINLDDIFVIKSKEEIIASLRDMYSAVVFDDCMEGFPGLTKSSASKRQSYSNNDDEDDIDMAPPARNAVPARPAAPSVRNAVPARPAPPLRAPAPQQQDVEEDYATEEDNAPVYRAPARPAPARPAAQAPELPVTPPVADIGSLPPNPMSRPKMSREEAMRFINEQ